MIVDHHVRGYREIYEKVPGLFEVGAVCDLIEDRAVRIAEQIEEFQGFRPEVYTDHERMLEIEELDAASVATSHFAHHEPTITALERGLHVVVEKPFAVTVKAGLKMIHAAERNNRKLACAEPMRRSLRSRAINWAINERELIGEPRFFFYQRARFNLGVVVGTPWRHNKLMSGGGWVLDGEVHYVDFLRMVFGDVEEVYGKIRNFEPTRYLDLRNLKEPVPSDVEDTAFAILTFRSGTVGSFIWTHAAPGREVNLVRYYGSKGCLDDQGVLTKSGESITMDQLEGEFMKALSGERKERLFPYGMFNPYSISFYDFLDSIRSDGEPEVSGREALAAQAVCEAIYESDACGRAVRVEEVISGEVDEFQRAINEHWGV
jgi:predicted dehydrogenase